MSANFLHSSLSVQSLCLSKPSYDPHAAILFLEEAAVCENMLVMSTKIIQSKSREQTDKLLLGNQLPQTVKQGQTTSEGPTNEEIVQLSGEDEDCSCLVSKQREADILTQDGHRGA